MADVSSTAISAALEEGTDPVGLLPKVVAAYARVHGLYWRGADPPQGPARPP
jgi:nicotinic acid mononucleotide adenylyltransferase